MGTNQGSSGGESAVKYGVAFGQVYRDELDCVRHRWRTVYPEDQYDLDNEPGDEEKAAEGAPSGGNAKRNTARRRIVCDEPSTANELVGLAFSGGGIRSATINMGIAQALERRGVFDHVDYMSTVSGGGYLGSGISTAMRKFEGGQGEFPYHYQEPEEQDEV